MSAVHDTITETLDRYHHFDDMNSMCDCGWYYGTPNEGGETYNGHLATAALEALSAAGFVVRKQVEPPALRQEWTWSWPNGSARGVPGYGYPVDSAEEALAEAGVHDRRNANVVTRFVSEWQQVEP